MKPLIEQYNGLFKKIKDIWGKISEAESSIKNITSNIEGDIPARIGNLEDQLVKIDDYMLKIEAFKKLAEKNLDSQNVLTIEAPPGYRVNLNRLRSWAMMIDPMSPNDPYAQRVYLVAKCDECFLEQKRQEFTERIDMLKSDEKTGLNAEVLRLEHQIDALKDELRLLALSEEVAEFASSVDKANKQFWFETAPEFFNAAEAPPVSVSPGAYAVPFVFEEDQRQSLKGAFGRFYDAGGGKVLLPVELQTDKEFAMAIACTPARSQQLSRGLQNFILSIINNYPAGTNKIYILDAVHFSSAILGSLKQLENTFAVNQIPRNPEQLSSALEQIVSSLADMDDLLELSDSVVEYNELCEPAKKLSRSTIFIVGWPGAFEARDREYVHRIMTNYERYGISFVSISYKENIKEDETAEDLPEYAAYNAVQISMLPRETTIRMGSGAVQRFTWYSLGSLLPESFAESLKAVKIEKTTTGSEYTKRYNLNETPVYSREYKKIELPFGVDAKDAAHSMSFENENFAAYLVGASRSGKSNLLHILITGIVRQYHPDNVELWLADFKQLEFKKYINHCPPHIKYILLDESTELVYDLIDRITAIMMERQRLFGRLGIERINQIKDTGALSEPLPVIFIILDEFSIMSQAIAESQIYKLRLQNVLAKGAALGIRFLFSSQTFTTGVAGLTQTARAQIQQRIAMKGSREEITETLELSANMKTDQVRNWIDALPPFYALQKHRVSADALPEVTRVNVMYVPDEEADLRFEMIDKIAASMKPVDNYEPGNIHSYVNKHPVLVDGNTYTAFNDVLIREYITNQRSISRDFSGEEAFLAFGTPRLMSSMKTAALSAETRENILLTGRDTEQACTAAILTSAMKSFMAQGKKVNVWCYGKNRLYKAYIEAPWSSGDYSSVNFVEGIDNVCDAIYDLKQNIGNKKSSGELIILIGIDRICADFDFINTSEGVGQPSESFADREKQRQEELKRRGAIATTEDQMSQIAIGQKLAKIRREVKEKAEAAGKSITEVGELVKEAVQKFLQSQNGQKETASDDTPKEPARQQEAASETLEPIKPAGHTPGAYNAKEDFLFVVKHGSRLGYHFMLYLNSFADLKGTGLKLDFFRHRMSFQISAEDSRELFGNKGASMLPEHICQYYDTLESFSFRPYMHRGITWEGWEVDENGRALNPYE